MSKFWDAADISEEEELLLLKNREERAYCKARETLVGLVQQYYRQDIYSTYIKEEQILSLVNECIEHKKAYTDLREQLLSGLV